MFPIWKILLRNISRRMESNNIYSKDMLPCQRSKGTHLDCAVSADEIFGTFIGKERHYVSDYRNIEKG